MKKRRILIIDDSLLKLEVTKKALIGNYDVLTALSGNEALDILEKERIDLILLDIEMPEMNGYQVMKKIKSIELFKYIPIIFLTSRSDEESELYGFSLGAVDYITTPFSPPRLLKRLELHLSLVNQKNELREFNENLKQLVAERTSDLQKALFAAQAADRAKTTFLANVSHEVRTPLNSIIGFSELAQNESSLNKTRSYIDRTLENAGWLLDIINNILDIPNIESGRIILDHIPFELSKLLAYCNTVFSPLAGEKGISLYCNTKVYTGKKLIGDPMRLRQVIMCLLSNAVKFTNSGTIELLTTVEKLSKTSVTIVFELKDSGIGITPEQIDVICQPFIQVDDKITRKVGGVGLGLTIAKSIIESMGGELKVESEVGKGSIFSFSLSFDLADDSETTPSNAIIFNDHEIPVFSGDVLVCEDNDLNMQVICDHLLRVGITPIVAQNGKEGVEIVEQRFRKNETPFDLILMDIHMPVIDGLDAAMLIIGMGVKTPIVAITANILADDIERYEKSGISDTVGKPFTSKELWRCLAKYLSVKGYKSINKNYQATEETKTLRLLKTNFARNNKNTFAELTQSLDNGNIKLAHRIAHTLKGNAGQIGEERLRSAAAVVDSNLKDGKNKLGSEQLLNLEIELALVLDELSPLLADSRKVSKIEEIDITKTLEMLDELSLLLKNKDTKCLRFLDEVYAIPGTEELVRQIEGCKFKKALASLDIVKERLVSADE